MARRQFAFPDRPRPEIRWVWFWRWNFITLIALLPLLLLMVMASLLDDDFSLAFVMLSISVGLLLVSALWGFIWSGLAVREYSFQIRDEDVVIQRGVVFRTRTLVPLRRVQDIIVQSGPLLRAWNLSSVKLQTAGGGAHTPHWGEGQLPGVHNGDAVAAELLERIKRLRGDV